MKQEFHVSSLVVLTQPSLRHQLADEIATLEGAGSMPSVMRASWW